MNEDFGFGGLGYNYTDNDRNKTSDLDDILKDIDSWDSSAQYSAQEPDAVNTVTEFNIPQPASPVNTSSKQTAGSAPKKKQTGSNSSKKGTNVRRKKKKQKKLSPGFRRTVYMLFFPLSIFYMEMIVNAHAFDDVLGWGVFYTFIFSVGFGFGCLFLVSLFNRKAAYIASIAMSALLLVIMGTQTVYFTIFQTFTVLAMVGMAAEAITNFFGNTMLGIWNSLGCLILEAVPLILVIFFGKRILPKKHNRPVAIVFIMAACVLITCLGSAMVRANTSGIMSYRYVYDETFECELSIQRFGVLTTLRQEIRNSIWDKIGYVPISYQEEDISVSTDTETFGDIKVADDEKTAEAQETVSGLPGGGMSKSDPEYEESVETDETAVEEETVKYVDRSPNTMSINFDAVSAQGGSNITTISDYLATQTPSNKNEYTGMFEGYNLIYICAEAFSRYAVSEKYTPTLYKLSHEGFVFNNFYNPIWTHSTSDGEFALLTGLVPYSGTRPMVTTADNSNARNGSSNNMYFAPGKVFGRIGYTTYAFHGHRYDYYTRDITHPNLGYTYIGVGNGIYFPGSSKGDTAKYYYESSGATSGVTIDGTWPESDVQVVNVTTDMYVNEQPFHVYYMSISGHAEYNFVGNAMCKKHKEDVQDLELSETAKAYVACMMEFDQSVQLLIEKLQAAGALEKTVIVICGDHYPYAITGNGNTVSDDGLSILSSLAGEELDKKFELYRSTLIIWNSTMGTIPVDKYCYSVDVLPTIYNLFGVEYDSRLLMGRDILSDSEGLVVFSNRSYITEYGRYDSSTDTFTPADGVTVPSGYTSETFAVVKNKIKYSEYIVKYDYYAYVF